MAAQSQTTGQTSLVDKIASRFNLNKDDVKKVFDEDRTAHEAEREVAMKTRLDQAVKDGKLTQTQEDKLIAKHKELETFRLSIKDKTEEERHTAMKTKMDEFKQWAKDNSIPYEFARPGIGPHGPGMDGPRGGM